MTSEPQYGYDCQENLNRPSEAGMVPRQAVQIRETQDSKN